MTYDARRKFFLTFQSSDRELAQMLDYIRDPLYVRYCARIGMEPVLGIAEFQFRITELEQEASRRADVALRKMEEK